MKRLVTLLACALFFVAPRAFAQQAGQGGGPTQTTPTKKTQVGPQRGADDDQAGASAAGRPSGEPSFQVPTDPLAIPEPVAPQIGSDYDGPPPAPEGTVSHSYFPTFETRKGDARVRLIPPLYLEHTRGLDPATGAATAATDTESLTALLFYHRRSPNMDADVLFPAAWRIRDRKNYVYVLGPLAHREAPGEHDNWVAPLFFEGKRKDGGYFHSPVLLTSSHWGAEGAFTVVGPYFRDRTGTDVDMGIAPFYFHGDNGDEDGTRKTYSLIPPLLFFHRNHEYDESQLTVVGPVITTSSPKRSVVDVAPLFYSIYGKPETGGVKETHLTLFPLFHYGTSPEENLFVLPGYLRRTTPAVDTMITPFYSNSTTRNKSTSLTFAGPVIPLFYKWTDVDVGERALGVFPFYYGAKSQRGEAFAIPIYARFENYNVSRTYWIFPTITYTKDLKGWETDVHPIVYAGRDGQSSHTVLAPIFWDFASPKGRTTIGFPVYWRFADTADGTVLQVAGNTLYRERRVAGGTDWQFHVLPFFSYGERPTGYWWDLFFGLAGYDKDGTSKKIKAFWLPIQVAGP